MLPKRTISRGTGVLCRPKKPHSYHVHIHPHQPKISRCLYHSTQQSTPSPFSPTESAILSHALRRVPQHDFSTEALQLGAKDAGYLSISTNLFPKGAFELVNYHMVTQRLALKQLFQRHHTSDSPSTAPSQPNIPLNLKSILQHRLLANGPVANHLSTALALSTLPENIPTALNEVALLVDEMLYLAGSSAVTTAWYTDRIGLAGIYTSAELFMTRDTSTGFKDTKAFAKSRIDEAEGARDGLEMLGLWVATQFGGAVDGLRSKGVWI